MPLDTGATACCDMRAEDAHTFEGGMADVDPPISLRPCQGQVAQGRGRIRIQEWDKSNYRTIAVQMSSMGTFSRGRKVPAKPSSEGHKQRELDVDGLARGRDGSSNLAPRGFEFHARHSA